MLRSVWAMVVATSGSVVLISACGGTDFHTAGVNLTCKDFSAQSYSGRGSAIQDAEASMYHDLGLDQFNLPAVRGNDLNPRDRLNQQLTVQIDAQCAQVSNPEFKPYSAALLAVKDYVNGQAELRTDADPQGDQRYPPQSAASPATNTTTGAQPTGGGSSASGAGSGSGGGGSGGASQQPAQHAPVCDPVEPHYPCVSQSSGQTLNGPAGAGGGTGTNGQQGQP